MRECGGLLATDRSTDAIAMIVKVSSERTRRKVIVLSASDRFDQALRRPAPDQAAASPAGLILPGVQPRAAG